MRGNTLADAVLATFRALPVKAKPHEHPGGIREWIPLSGLVATNQATQRHRCIALGTGMRCLPARKLELANGTTLHDWHAEVVAIRAFNHYLLQQCTLLATNSLEQSELVRTRMRSERTTAEPQPFAIKDDVQISMVSTDAPCGDASMELVMNAQVDATPWTTQSQSEEDGMLVTGRGHFGELGIVRRKPARGDAPPTLSKSCSDKLAMKQCTSLLSSLTSLFVHPGNAYLHELIISENQLVPTAVERAFSPEGRLRPLDANVAIWKGGYSFKPFRVTSHDRPFEFARYLRGSKGSNTTALWTPGLSEVLIGGTKQGFKQFSYTGSSAVSRYGMWREASMLVQILEDDDLSALLGNAGTYAELKHSDALKARRDVQAFVKKKALTPWPKNEADDFSLKEDDYTPTPTSHEIVGSRSIRPVEPPGSHCTP